MGLVIQTSLMIVTKGRFSGLRETKPDWSGFEGEARKWGPRGKTGHKSVIVKDVSGWRQYLET